ncbi:MAG: two-component sensor histidine kinase [Prolixibacteraceae bacterium]|jgi:two-component system, NtrC family, sensor kinase|nr:two-component sensor histidine kinase [Prolixibacteraceae bacterium]MBT6006180.1 two-component sensor histidine kinase [Prolixibacteraceae bacterium]MBT6767218.1 two-component sensor histidine kinase [Prolixibacteraceae bacterium]MBT6997515.1 two-component sensor histidine kinase [Prolixibacteraceae bacterium]MBT7394591.1 two-component sensor histidine kinase [Prolixibacteraceae bacterium]
MGIQEKDMDTNKDQSLKKEQDITGSELKDLQQRFIESDKLASVGRLTAGILHEIKNPLNFVNNFTKLSLELLAELKELMEDINETKDKDIITDIEDVSSMLESNLKRILENGERAQRIIFTMLDQVHEKQETVFEPTDINKLVDEFAKLAYHGVRGTNKEFNMTFKTDYDPAIDKVNVGVQEISRVIINIVNNACYALNEKKSTMKNSFSPEISLKTKKHKDFVEIIIRDNGTGMPKSVIDKIFKPFFTTKPKGQGTGLGLSLSYEIITKIHNGKIRISSVKNEFTEFALDIPTSLK